jgi:hypothetical protein
MKNGRVRMQSLEGWVRKRREVKGRVWKGEG